MTNESVLIEELEKLLTEDRINRIDSVLKNRTTSLTIVLENIEHKHNISAVIRTAEAFGLSKIHILNKNLIKNSDLSDGISLGTEKWVSIQIHSSKEELVEDLKKEGFKLVALLPPEINRTLGDLKIQKHLNSQDSMPVSLLPFEEKLALLFGNEVSGISDFLRESSDIHAYIPMSGFVESLNISVACAITLYASTIEKAKPQKRTQKLSESERTYFRQDWIKKSVQNVEVVLRSLSKKINS
jgi:tRNA (guanosine-2'-O-)-methyltransferase